MRRRGVARTLTAVMLLVLPTILTGLMAGPVNALPGDPAPPEPPPAADVKLAWPTLGLESATVLVAAVPASFTMPVPPGLAPVRLTGLINAPTYLGATGYLEIGDGEGNFLAAVDLPPATAAKPVQPFDVDISAARVRASSIVLSFTVHPFDSDRTCGPPLELPISNLATSFTGAEPPVATIATFFPPVLEQVMVYAPTDADVAEQQSVLTLVSTLANLYRSQRPAIRVFTQQRGAMPPPARQLARAIVVETGPAGLTVENAGNPGAYLRISGRGDALTTQVSLLANQLQALAQTPAARVDQAGSGAALSGDTLTFSQLNMGGRTGVFRSTRMAVGVDRAALGTGRVGSVQVHLLADYTPVPKDDAASVVIRSKGVVVYRAALDATGQLNATFDLESPTFGQRINLDFALTYTPREFCRPFATPIAFQVDPRSTLTIHRGGPPPDGFSAAPSEFSPSFVVALDGSGPGQLTYAARVVAAIAVLTNKQLTPQLVDLGSAADATSGALIVASSAAISKTSLDPPVGGDGPALSFGLPTELRADIDGGLGSIQAFADRPRNRSVILVTTTAAWTLVDPLFNYIDGLDGGWSALSGDLLAAGAAGTPTNLAIRATGDFFQPPPSPPPHSLNPWLFSGAGAAAVAAIAIVAVALWSRRRTRSTGAHATTNTGSTD